MNTGKLFSVSLITVPAAFSGAKIPAQAFSSGLSSTISGMIWAGIEKNVMTNGIKHRTSTNSGQCGSITIRQGSSPAGAAKPSK